MIRVRKGLTPNKLTRPDFSLRFRASFVDPVFLVEENSISRLEEIAWEAYIEGRKAPITEKEGIGYDDPNYKLSSEWVATKKT